MKKVIYLIGCVAAFCVSGSSFSQNMSADGKAEGTTASVASGLPPGIVARVNGVAITKAKLDTEIGKIFPLARGNITPEFIDAVKSQMIAQELIRQAAYAQGLENDDEVKAAVKYAESAAMVQTYVKKNIRPRVITDAEIREQYNALLDQLGPAEYKIRTIEVSDAVTATIVENELAKGADFKDLANKISSAKNRSESGEMPWISFKAPPQKGKTQGLPLLVADALLSLSLGEYTPKAIHDEGKYTFVKLEAMRPTQIPSFEEAKGAIQKALEAKAAQEASLKMMEDLMSKATIEQ